MIRKLEKADADQVIQIWLNGNIEAHSFIRKEYWEANSEMVKEQLLQAEVYVYEAADLIQGFVGIQDNYIAGIFVKKEFRSSGVGKQLLDFIKEKHDSLTLHVYQKNQRAMSFYKREGFFLTSEDVDPDTGEADLTMQWNSNKMVIREYQTSDCKEMAELFYNTVHNVNKEDYTKEQLDVWATGQVDLEQWDQSFRGHYSLVAFEDGKIVGFGDIDETGYLDHLYIHADYQGKGIATALCNRLEKTAKGNITTHASITARPFFEKRGYRVVKEQQVERKGIFLTNYCMEKKCD